MQNIREMATPTPQELVESLIDGARYGDMEDVEAAIAQGVAMDGADHAGRTGVGPMQWEARMHT